MLLIKSDLQNIEQDSAERSNIARIVNAVQCHFLLSGHFENCFGVLNCQIGQHKSQGVSEGFL